MLSQVVSLGYLVQAIGVVSIHTLSIISPGFIAHARWRIEEHCSSRKDFFASTEGLHELHFSMHQNSCRRSNIVNIILQGGTHHGERMTVSEYEREVML